MTMDARIIAYGAYLPIHRLTAASLGRKGSTARTLAGPDEDSLTLAVAAARNALAGAGNMDRSEIDALIFATTSAPYGEKQGAAIAAKTLGLRDDVMTFDITASTRSGTQALHAAGALVASGRIASCLVIAGDVRQMTPGDAAELEFGDAGAALLLGNRGGFGRIGVPVQLSNEMLDVWRGAGERFVHGWENRFILDHGYKDQIGRALDAMAKAEGGNLQRIDRIALYAPDSRSLREIAAAHHLPLERVIGRDWPGRIGCTGASFALLQLCAGLEEAQAGERLLLANYGDGADAAMIELDVAPPPPARSLAGQEALGRVVSHAWYLSARQLLATEFEPGGEPGNSATAHYRERDANLSLEGQVCQCGTHQFPKGRICVRCGCADHFQPVRYADRHGSVITYSRDAFFPNPSPPTVITVTEVAGGPRLYLQATDADADEIGIGTEVEFTFRRIHQVGRRPNYFWKVTPVRGKLP
ncbi:MAG: hypothetical protein JSR19_13495 [Proteobacteria bacterium]|nr:hypothetical protein [Pseudomonadota bacterium]HQR02775.1 hypothetical protein [Rhodocyclaceae bacterium]